MINPQWLGLPITRINFYGPDDVRAIEVLLYIVVVRIFNATRHPRHIEAAAIVMYMYLYSLAFMDDPCTLGAAVTKRRPVHFILNPGHVEYELGVLMV